MVRYRREYVGRRLVRNYEEIPSLRFPTSEAEARGTSDLLSSDEHRAKNVTHIQLPHQVKNIIHLSRLQCIRQRFALEMEAFKLRQSRGEDLVQTAGEACHRSRRLDKLERLCNYYYGGVSEGASAATNTPFSSSSFESSPFWCIDIKISQPPTNSFPIYSCGIVGQSEYFFNPNRATVKALPRKSEGSHDHTLPKLFVLQHIESRKFIRIHAL